VSVTVGDKPTTRYADTSCSRSLALSLRRSRRPARYSPRGVRRRDAGWQDALGSIPGSGLPAWPPSSATRRTTPIRLWDSGSCQRSNTTPRWPVAFDVVQLRAVCAEGSVEAELAYRLTLICPRLRGEWRAGRLGTRLSLPVASAASPPRPRGRRCPRRAPDQTALGRLPDCRHKHCSSLAVAVSRPVRTVTPGPDEGVTPRAPYRRGCWRERSSRRAIRLSKWVSSVGRPGWPPGVAR
jgi:hypothetical protein